MLQDEEIIKLYAAGYDEDDTDEVIDVDSLDEEDEEEEFEVIALTPGSCSGPVGRKICTAPKKVLAIS